MKLIKQISLAAILGMMIFVAGCDKTKPYGAEMPPRLAHFVGDLTQTYSVVDDPAPSYTLQIGTTDVSSEARTVTYIVSSPTGAVAGTHYNIIGGSNTVNIPANGTLADIVVQANYAEYAAGRKDTLIFSLATPSVEPAQFQDTVMLAITGPTGCSEAGLTSLDDLLGIYANTRETLDGNPYGPYTTTISAVTITSPTTGTVVVQNIWNNGWGPITFELDWTDPINRTTTVVAQTAIPGSDAGDLNPTYAGETIAVRPNSGSGPGTYSYCDQTLTLNMDLGVTGIGYFGILYQVILRR